MAIDIRDLDEEVTIYYRCPHCEGFSQIWILADELASKIRRMIKGEPA